MRASSSLFLAAVVVALAALARAQPDPDLPGFPGDIQNLYSCSIVIPVDSNQLDSFGVLQLNAYGLVAHLLWSDIPVLWVIKTGKAHNDVDFSAQTWRFGTLPGQYERNSSTPPPAPVVRSFRGGPFVVERQYLEFAWPFIASYQARQPTVKLFQLAETVQADVRYNLLKKPKVAIMDSSQNNIVQRQLLEHAGFVQGQHYAIFTRDQANNLSAGTCITVATEPHFHAYQDWGNNGWSPQFSPQAFTKAMRTFVESGGNFLAQCGGISTYENCDTGSVGYTPQGNGSNIAYQGVVANRVNFARNCSDGLFMTQFGIMIRSGLAQYRSTCNTLACRVNGTKYFVADTPVAQFTGPWGAYSGSVPVMGLWNMSVAADQTALAETNKVDSGWRTENFAHPVVGWPDPNAPARDLYLVAHAKIGKFRGKLGGNVVYLAGHRYYDLLIGLPTNLCPVAPNGYWQCPAQLNQKPFCINGDNDCDPIFANYNTSQCNALSAQRFNTSGYNCEFNNGGDLNSGRQIYLNTILLPADRDPACNFNVDACKWGVCVFVRRRAALDAFELFAKGKDAAEQARAIAARKRALEQSGTAPNTSNIPKINCDCTRVFDCVGNCGGDGTPANLCEFLGSIGGLGQLTSVSTGVIGSAVQQGPATQQPNPSAGGAGSVPPPSGPVATGGPVPTSTSTTTSTGAPSGVPSTGPLPPANWTGGLQVTLNPGEWKCYLANAGSKVCDVMVFTTALSPGDKVDLYLKFTPVLNSPNPAIPTTTDYSCYEPNVVAGEFSYQDQILATVPATCSSATLPAASWVGDWVVCVTPSAGSTRPVTATVEVFLEPCPSDVVAPPPPAAAPAAAALGLGAALVALVAAAY